MAKIADRIVSKIGERTGQPSEGSSSGNGARKYNYRQFRFVPERDGSHDGVKSGEQAPDVTVYTLDGEPVSLASLWEDRPAVIEFGSITCPVFTANVDTMEELAARYGDAVDFYVVYTREAHPGDRYSHHTSLEQKCQHARDAKRDESLHRDVLVDDVDGAMHRAYGSLPNSAYVIGRDGVVAHHADWLDVGVLEERIDELLDNGGRGAEVTPDDLEGNIFTPDPHLLRTVVRVQRRAGAGSPRDLLVSLPDMITYRVKQQLERVFGDRTGSPSQRGAPDDYHNSNGPCGRSDGHQ